MGSPKGSNKTVKTISQTFNDTDPMASLRAKLKTADPEIQNYVTALETENLKLQRQVGNLQAKNVSLNNRIEVLTEENEWKGPSLEEVLRQIEGRKLIHNEPPKKE